MRFVIVAAACLAVALSAPPTAAQQNPLLSPESIAKTAPAEFHAMVTTTVGAFVMKVRREWAPNGADRFYSLATAGYYTNNRFFRVIPKFMAQVGLHGDPAVAAAWQDATIPSDRPLLSNMRGKVTFAKGTLASSRTTQFFINFGDNSRLDIDGFAPFGEVITSMVVVERLYSEYGEGPDQGLIVANGNAWLQRYFPRMDYIKSITIE